LLNTSCISWLSNWVEITQSSGHS